MNNRQEIDQNISQEDDGSDDIMYLGSDDENNDDYKKRWNGEVQSEGLEQFSPNNAPPFVWGQSYRPSLTHTQPNTTSVVIVDDMEAGLVASQKYEEQRKTSALNQFSTFAAKKEAPNFGKGEKSFYPEHIKAPTLIHNLKDLEPEIDLFKGNPGTKYPFSDSDDEFDSATLHLTQQQHAKIQRTRLNPLHTNQGHQGESFIITLHYPVSSISIILDKIIRETNIIKIEALPAYEALCPDSCSYNVVTTLQNEEVTPFIAYLNNKYPIENSQYEGQNNSMMSCNG